MKITQKEIKNAQKFLKENGKEELAKLLFYDTETKTSSELMATLLEGYHQSEVLKLNIHNVSNRFSDQKFIDNVCLSYRHDFGLMTDKEKDKLIFECKEWMRAIKNNE